MAKIESIILSDFQGIAPLFSNEWERFNTLPEAVERSKQLSAEAVGSYPLAYSLASAWPSTSGETGLKINHFAGIYFKDIADVATCHAVLKRPVDQSMYTPLTHITFAMFDGCPEFAADIERFEGPESWKIISEERKKETEDLDNWDVGIYVSEAFSYLIRTPRALIKFPMKDRPKQAEIMFGKKKK